MDQLLGNDSETNDETTVVVKQRPARQWIGRKAVFSAGFAPMAAHETMDTTMISFSTRSMSMGL
jgi:hypothetical protein